MKLKIACVQTNPIIGQVERNINRIRDLLANVPKVDFVVLPELAITGYNFPNREAIQPFLESSVNGKSVKLAEEISKRYQCFTLIGYPEIFEDRIYNSAALVSPSGSLLYNYRKTFLYETDEEWGCDENPDKLFSPIELIIDKEYYIDRQPGKPYSKVVTSIGICMDLNPYKFEAPFNKFEMSLSSFLNRSKLIICPMAWLSPQSPSIDEKLLKEEKQKKAEIISDKYYRENKPHLNLLSTQNDNAFVSEPENTILPKVPSFSTVHYWILRFFPFLNHPSNDLPKYYDKVTLITCNRVGIERDVMYGGSSSIIQFKNVRGTADLNNRNPSVQILGSLGQVEEGVLLRDIDVETQA
ncbi:uncharacterized protein PRCAT00001379001 [Priceomyces carsonii]|uniref:uncharacterized protein n=1 Tax=Priceomyces carsonii TaxID=28549 RepID=UPI002ED91498|nr:unnamed protein product [Priceomyces carsonii]